MRGIDVLKRVCLWAMAGFGFLCLVLIVLNRWYDIPHNHQMQSLFGVQCSSENTSDTEDADTLKGIQELIESARQSVHEDMMGYPYPNGKYNISATKLEDLVIDKNGTPIRSIVLSTWRSGSTFSGDILNAHPGNFYFFESLAHFDSVQVRGPPLASPALKHLKALLNCEFAGLAEYIKFVERNSTGQLFGASTYLWGRCKARNGTCFDHRYLSSLCQLLPFQIMKLVRLRLNVAQELLSDEKLGVRMVLLVRDPRGTMRSRKNLRSCPRSPDCYDPGLYCADLVRDYKIAVKLIKQYPTTFRVIRYEDLSTDPYEEAKEIFNFYGRYFDPKVERFLETHTTKDAGGRHSTFRDSKSTPFRWKSNLTFEEVDEIQRTCAVAMEHWGYVPAMNATHLREFNPVTDYNMTNL